MVAIRWLLLIHILFPNLVFAINERLPVYDGSKLLAEYDVILDDSGSQILAIDLLSSPTTSGSFLSPEIMAKIRTLSKPQRIQDLKTIGLVFLYDPKELKIQIQLPTSDRSPEIVSMHNRAIQDGLRPSDVPPEPVSALINLYPQYRYGDANEFQGQADAALRFSNFVFVQEAQVIDESPVRRDSKIVYDFPRYYLRTSLGEVQSTSSDLLTPVNVLGFSAHTDFGMTLFGRPLPNPSTELILERRARVNAYSRGQLLQSLVIGPGRFRLQDFQFINGITEVVFDIQEFGGRSYTLTVPYAVDERQLQEGGHEYSYTAGRRYQDDGKFRRYEKNNDVITALHRYGASNKNTIGYGLQADESHQVAGLEVLSVHSIGSFYPKVHISKNGRQQGQRANLEYLLRFYGDKQFNLDYTYETSNFARWDQLPSGNSHFAAIGLVTRPSNWWSIGLKSARQWRHQAQSLDRYEININGRSSHGLNSTLGFRRNQLNQSQWENSVTLFLNYFFDNNRHSLETAASYREADGSPTQSDVRLAGRGFYQTQEAQFTPQVSTSRSSTDGQPTTQAWQANLDMRHARADFSLDHDYRNERHTGTAAAGVGIALTKSAIAFGRPSPGAYTVVKNELDRPIEVDGPGLYASYPVEKIPLLVAGLRPYDYPGFSLVHETDEGEYQFHQKRLATAYFSAHVLEYKPRYLSNARFEVRDVKNRPIPLLQGQLQNITTLEVVEFFSNRTGLVLVEGLIPGEWQLKLGKKRRLIHIPERSGMLDLGAIYVE